MGSIIPAARTKSRHTRHATPRKRLTTNHHAQTVVHYTPNTPCHPHSTEVDCTLATTREIYNHRPLHLHGHATLALPSNHAEAFATIDPRHAGDTPQSSAYGSNSPQATNENKPHHQDNWTRMSNTTHATTTPETYHQPPQQTQATTPTATAQGHTHTTAQGRTRARVEHRAGIAKGAGVSRPLARGVLTRP